MFSVPTPVLEVAGLFLTIFGSIWSLAWWLSGKFTELRGLIYATAEKTSNGIISKLEYHEKHDDVRFATLDSRLVDLRDDVWDIRVRNSAIDGLPALISRDKEK